MPTLKCDTALNPELDPLWASGCQECFQLGSGAREKIKHSPWRTAVTAKAVYNVVSLCVHMWVGGYGDPYVNTSRAESVH